jgi:hypothetical protein
MSAQHEFHRDLDENVDRHAQPARRRKLPLPDRVDRALVQASTQTATDRDLADCSIAVDDDFKKDVPRHAAPASLVRVQRLDLSEQARRLDTASRTIRPAPNSSSGAWPDAGTNAFTVAGTATRRGSASCACALAGTFVASALGHADALVTVRDGGDRRHESPGREWILNNGSRSRDRGWSWAPYFNLSSAERGLVR